MKIAWWLLLCVSAHAETYKITTTTGVKSFGSKGEAARFVLLNEKSVKTIERTQEVELTDKLSFKTVRSGR